jgi:flagellar biosynthetic protein FlhB
MSGEESSGEKSFEPTPKRLEDARRRGEVPKSVDLATAASYLGFILAAALAGPAGLEMTFQVFSSLISQSDHLSTVALTGGATTFLATLIRPVTLGILPYFALPALLVLLTLFAQRAIIFAPQKIAPKLNKISIITGAKNKFGPHGLFEFAKSAAKLGLVSALLFWFAVGKLEEILVALMTSPAQIMMQLSDLVVEFLIIVFVMSLLVGGVDYLWQVSEHIRKNRMTRQEVTDEAKQSEGDPHHKQSRRQRAYDIAMNQMLSDVPGADVVIVNPTHYAVALKWDRNSKQAPICVAKGVDEIAAKIREIARDSKISIHSDPPTARALHATVDVGSVIKSEHYRAVAAAIRFAEDMRAKAREKVTS